jgi:type I restriction enzyme S subunit
MASVEYVKLSEVCNVNQGLQIAIDKRYKEPAKNRYFYITVQFLKDGHLEKYYVESPPSSSICNEEDIIVVRTGNTGQVLTGISGCFHNNFFKVNFNKEKILGSYLYHCLSSKEKQYEMKKRAGITTIPDLNHFMFLDMQIPLPNLEQQEIAAQILDNLNAKIDLNNRINAELEAMAKTLYDYWFVQFDFPDANGKPYKTAGGKMVYNPTLKREIPEGWSTKKLDDVISRSGTGLNPRDNFSLGDGDNYYITIKDIEQGRIIFSEKSDRIDDEAMHIINKRSDLKAGDVLFTSIEPVGVTYLLHETPSNWNINESVFTLRANKDMISPEYLFLLLSSEHLKVYCKNSSTGSIHKGIRHAVLKDYPFAYSGYELIKQFTKIIQPILEKQELVSKQNLKLTQLRDWLLPMLMNGQVTVK